MVCLGLVELVAWKLLYRMFHCLFDFLLIKYIFKGGVNRGCIYPRERVDGVIRSILGYFSLFWNGHVTLVSTRTPFLPDIRLLSREASWPWCPYSPFSHLDSHKGPNRRSLCNPSRCCCQSPDTVMTLFSRYISGKTCTDITYFNGNKTKILGYKEQWYSKTATHITSSAQRVMVSLCSLNVLFYELASYA